jgi:hypothetical protein
MVTGSLNDIFLISLLGKKFRAVLDSNGSYLYIGYAPAGVSTSEPKWQIQKFKFDDSFTTTPISSDFANGQDDFNKIWDNRTSYTYDL